MDKNKSISLASIVIIVGSYAVVKLLGMFTASGRTETLILAFTMTALLGVVVLLLSKCESAFMGLLASIIGYKMMPVGISGLKSASLDASMLYSIVQKAGVLLFILLIIKFYRMQNSHDKIKVLPILAIMFSVTFANGISSESYSYFTHKTGSMLGYYFTCFVCYIIASMVIMLVAYTSNYESMRFAAYFQFVAMAINLMRRISVVLLLHINSAHISKSYYCWIVIYIAVIVCFFVAKEHKKKSLEGMKVE